MAHNGGRSQINFNFLQSGGEYPFLDHIKTAQNWSLIDNSSLPAPDTLGATGFPISISNGGVYTVFFIPLQASRPGKYVVIWTGGATVDSTGTLFAGAKTNLSAGVWNGQEGRAVFTITGDAADVTGLVIFQITAIDASNPITACAYVHEDDEAIWRAGNVFGVKFKQRLVEANFGVLRFLNWQPANTSNVRYWADRKPAAYYSYSAHEARASLYGGVTTNSGDDYSVSAPSGWAGLVDKAMVIVKFNASASGDSATLNVGATGAKTIRNQSGDATSAGGNTRPLSGRFAVCIYEQVLDCWIKHGGDLGFGHVLGLISGVPLELDIQLCEEVGAHPWHCMPYLACDPITDWPTSLATYSAARPSANWMIPRYDGINEQWNTSVGFYGTRYGWNKANAHWGTTEDTHNFQGKIISTLGQAISAVYGGDRTKYQVICGVQTFGSLTPNDRLNSTQYVSVDGGSAAKNWATHVSCATYYRDTYSSAERTAAASDYAAADVAGKLVIATALANSVAVDGLTGNEIFGMPNVARLYAGWRSWADGFGLELCAYEGGYTPDYESGQTNLNALYAASKVVSSLYGHTLTNYNNFLAEGGEFPSCFQFGGASNAWSVLDPDLYASDPPQWDAIVDFNARRSRVRLTAAA